jgi:SNF2 family DNA or RNA helicase
MKYLPHQIAKAEQALNILREQLVVYIAGKPRSGKTATAIKVAEDSKLGRWLVLTKKAAISGWLKFTEDEELGTTKTYHVINYEQVGRKVGNKFKLKISPKDYDGVILDEGHNFGAFPKPSSRVKMARMVAHKLPLIVLSGTAVIESPMQIYHQLWITRFTPFKHTNFYDFHRQYGIPYYIKAGGRNINQYDKAKPELLEEIQKFTIFMTQEEAGIKLQVEDKVHYVELPKEHRALYNELQEHQLVNYKGNTIVCDSVMKLRTTLHMLESGVVKIDEEYIDLELNSKIDYLVATFPDTEHLGIMCHFIGERNKLKKRFKRAKIYSSNAHAEGVDLSHLKDFVILSSDYSGAKFVQRRERIANINGSNTSIVHHILVKKAISEQVYKATSKKMDFNNSTYERGEI